jgi:SM-20-related protein
MFMSLLDLTALHRAPITRDPFLFTLVSGFVPTGIAGEILGDFPKIDHPGLLPVEATHFGPRFGDLIAQIRNIFTARAFSEKFDIDLVGRPMMITVRGRCQKKDGRIHTDSEAKLVTALLYFNDRWEAPGGRLRLLRGPNNIDDAIVEAPPDSGTLVAFRRSDRSFHGHEPFTGVRRYIMINWMAGTFAARRELLRHHISARAKRIRQHLAAPFAAHTPGDRGE